MNYFPFHIGDYAAHTAHLEPMEDLAYRRLIELYYLREGPLPADIQATAKLIRMRSMLADVESVLREFFTLTEEGWFHSRCDAELNAMLHRQQMAKDKANKRWHQPEKVLGNATASEKDAAAYAAASKKDAEAMLPTPVPVPVPIPKEKEESGVAQARTPPPAFIGDENISEIPGRAIVALDPRWELPEAWGLDAEALGWKPPEIIREAEKFRQHWVVGKGAGTRRGIKGWRSSWSNWLANAEKFNIRRVA